MLYLEDYLELIEHLPQELRDRFTFIREQDLQVQNKSERLNEKNQSFFAEAKKYKPEQRQSEYENLLKEYDEIIGYADDKIQVAIDMQNLLLKLTQRLDSELEKFKLDLEADHSGITEELEKRSSEVENKTFDLYNNNNVNHNRQQPAAVYSPAQSDADYSLMSGPGSVVSDTFGFDAGHYENNLSSFGNNSGFKTSTNKKKIQNIDSNLPQHSALGAALSSTSPQMNSSSSPQSSYWYPWYGSLDNSNPYQGNTPIYQRDETKYCICRQVSYGEMVACDNNECGIEWFHYNCVGITQKPKGKWYCPDCNKKVNGHNHTSGSNQVHGHKKRGRKETKSVFNLVNNSVDPIRNREAG